MTTISHSPALTKTNARMDAVERSGLLHSPQERALDTLVSLARGALNCKIALITLIDDDRQWFKARCGLELSETPIEQSFCAHSVEADSVLVVPDAPKDPRFCDNPLVTGSPHIRFYAGAPIHFPGPEGTNTSVAIGTLCVIDDEPRDLSVEETKVLVDLAQLVESLITVNEMAARSAHLVAASRRHVVRLEREQKQFRQAERMANIGSWHVMLESGTVEWSAQVFAIHGLPVGQPPALDAALAFYPPHARAVLSETIARSVETGEPFSVETDFVAADGEAKRVRSMGEIEMLDGKAAAIIGVFQDVTLQYGLEQRLRRSAHIDALTEIANRAGCNEALDAAIAAARSDGTPLALLLIDLDGFKSVNDRCGHIAGDDLLQSVATRLQAASPAGSFVGRLGGDEFVVIHAPSSSRASIGDVVGAILAAMRTTIAAPDGGIDVSGTIGVSWLDENVHNRSELLRRADLALYHAKRTLPGGAVAYTPVDDKAPALATLASRLSSPATHSAEYDPEFTVLSPPVTCDARSAAARSGTRLSSSGR